MFCVKCGTKLNDGVNFCTNCGTNIEFAPPPVEQQAAYQQPVLLLVLSIIGFVIFPVGIIINSSIEFEYDVQIVSLMFVMFGYALAHAIVASVQGSKYRIKVISVLAVLGIIWYALCSICIIAFMYEDFEVSEGWVMLGLIYALIFSTVTFCTDRHQVEKP